MNPELSIPAIPAVLDPPFTSPVLRQAMTLAVSEGGSNVVDVYIRYLRKKIDTGFNKKLLHTIRGAGYVLREEK